ncbi:hypothetical protein [Salinivibrio kushneri]|uniref:Uncharacterized protein n=1 Tax=Salinivibrio kushneri TaxID=1908198 RepID=A0AA47KJ25_9GAMM|nr:hypothetical protein [Salinivibrio kushneri]WBA07768.1 hypothetical protein N8M53_07810 [Salinivibrio kushneri]
MQSVVIKSEDDAWKLLSEILDSDKYDNYLEFQNWPNISINIKGDRYSSTLPASLLEKLSFIQRNLNSFYGETVYDGDARFLKKADKHEIELVYSIVKGSTDIKADATGLLNKLGESMAKPSTQKITAITLCFISLAISGAFVIGNHMDNIKEIEIEKQKTLQKAIEALPQLKDTSGQLHSTFRKIISAASDADSIKLGDIELGKNEINRIAEKDKNKYEKDIVESEFKVTSLRGYDRHYSVGVTDLKNNRKFTAKLYKHSDSDDDLSLLAKSLTSEESISLVVGVKVIDNNYANAEIFEIKT